MMHNLNIHLMEEQLGIMVVVGTVFYGIYSIIKITMDYLLRRRIIKMGHVDKANILAPVQENSEDKRYPTLKYGLVAFFGGIGLVIIDLIGNAGGSRWVFEEHSLLPLGIELVFISAGFLSYFLYINLRKKS